MVGAIAAGLGYAFRGLFILFQVIRAAAGPALVIFGIAHFSVAAATIAAGLLIIWLNTTPREAAK